MLARRVEEVLASRASASFGIKIGRAWGSVKLRVNRSVNIP